MGVGKEAEGVVCAGQKPLPRKKTPGRNILRGRKERYRRNATWR